MKINLEDLVESATAEMLDQRDFDILCDAVPVLVEAVKAAHEVVVSPRQVVDDRLVGALARFEFGT